MNVRTYKDVFNLIIGLKIEYKNKQLFYKGVDTMTYYVIYDWTQGYEIYSEPEIDLMNLEDCTIEFTGTKEECEEFMVIFS